MDDLPKNQSNDLSGFSGTYPTEPKTPDTSVPPPPTSPPVTPNVADPFGQTPAPPAQPAAAATPVFTTTAGVTPPVTTTTAVDNPFVVKPEGGSAPKKGFPKRLVLLIVMLLVLLGLGFLSFQVIGKFLAGRQPVTLTYWGLWENENLLQPIVEEYKKTHPNIEVVYSKQSPRQYRERLQAAIDRGEGPDIFRFHSTWVPMLQSQLAPAGITGYTAAEFQSTFYPVANSDLVLGGKVYGVPLMFDGLGLYYNEDLLRAAGVSPPTTWEDFRKAALALTVKDEAGSIVTAGAALGTATNVEHFSDILALMMLQNGADMTNPTSKEAQDALTFYHLFAEKPNQVWDETQDNSILAFANGKVAMIFAPSWEVFEVLQTNPNLKFQVIPVPQLPGGNTTWASYWAEGVSNKSSHQEAAWEFLKFLSSKESLISLYTEMSKVRAFGEPYSRVDLAQTIINDQYVGAYIRQAQTAKTFFLASRTFDNGINDRMIKYLEDAVTSLGRGVSPQEALSTAAQGFSQVLSSFGFGATTPPAPAQ